LMDVQMPVIDGYKCTHILRHHLPYSTFTRDVPIVAMTASAIQGDREKCTKAGMDDYLAKPVKSQTLEKMLVRWSKTGRRPAPVKNDSQLSISDCSESGDNCVSVNIPRFALDDTDAETATPDERSSIAAEIDRSDDDRYNLLTPKPLTRNGSHDVTTFPFGNMNNHSISSPSQQLDNAELAMQLRDDKMLDAAGGDSLSLASPLSEGDSLTTENIEKLENEAAKPRVK